MLTTSSFKSPQMFSKAIYSVDRMRSSMMATILATKFPWSLPMHKSVQEYLWGLALFMLLVTSKHGRNNKSDVL